jgi:hypothetical protein
MSDNWLRLVPSDPSYQPSRPQAERAKTLLASFVPRADEVNVEFTDTVEFIHPAGNWAGVNCPACAADAEAWWEDAMRAAAATGFADLHAVARCCGVSVSLNEMRYVWPAAFARFGIEALNPGIDDLTPTQVQALATCLGCELRAIWIHI